MGLQAPGDEPPAVQPGFRSFGVGRHGRAHYAPSPGSGEVHAARPEGRRARRARARAHPRRRVGATGRGPTASVALGDSFISGEAGRWQGNSNDQLFSRDGTDRAYVRTWYGGRYDTSRVYAPPSDANGCHRSDVAEIRSASLGVTESVNLACSGAVASDVWRAASGGTVHDGEPPQADQLAPVAAAKDVREVVLSVGGNDLGFASIIATCATDFTVSPSWAPLYCQPSQQALVTARMPTAMANVGKAIDEVRATMAAQGYAPAQYRFVLQSYPSPVARGTENRYPESGYSRLTTGGCPFYDRDSDWARDSLVDQIADNLRAVASAKGVQFLDLRDLLQGREVCAAGKRLGAPSETTSEWTRFLVSGVGQGDLQESFHPNAYAERALGRCLTLLGGQSGGACRTAPGQGVASVTVSPLAAARGARIARRARPRPLRPAAPRWPSRQARERGR